MALQTRCLKCSISFTLQQALMLWNHKNILLFLISKPLFIQKWIPLFSTSRRCSPERQCHQFWNLWRSGIMIFAACWNWTAINAYDIVARLNTFHTNVLMMSINIFSLSWSIKKWLQFLLAGWLSSTEKWPKASLEIKICFSNIIDK